MTAYYARDGVKKNIGTLLDAEASNPANDQVMFVEA